MHGQRHSRWRAVDQDDNVLDMLGPSRRHPPAAKQFVRTLLPGRPYVPRVISTANRHLLSAPEYRKQRRQRVASGAEVTGTERAA